MVVRCFAFVTTSFLDTQLGIFAKFRRKKTGGVALGSFAKFKEKNGEGWPWGWIEKHWKVLYSTLRAPIIQWISLVLTARPLKSVVLYAQRTNNQVNFVGFGCKTIKKCCTLRSENQYFIEFHWFWALYPPKALYIPWNVDSLSIQYNTFGG